VRRSVLPLCLLKIVSEHLKAPAQRPERLLLLIHPILQRVDSGVGTSRFDDDRLSRVPALKKNRPKFADFLLEPIHPAILIALGVGGGQGGRRQKTAAGGR
jgi:hypothetical protein